MISNRCARKYLVTNCNSIISKNYLRFLVDSNEIFLQIYENLLWNNVKLRNLTWQYYVRQVVRTCSRDLCGTGGTDNRGVRIDRL